LIGPETIRVKIDSEYQDWGATALDGDQVITYRLETSGLPVDTSTAGFVFVSYTVEDSKGCAAQRTRTIRVTDPNRPNQKPVIRIIGDDPVEVEQNTDYIDRGATATDDEDGAVTVVPHNPVDTSKLDTYTVRYTATDSQGQPADPRTRIVRVVENPGPSNQRPVITIIGDDPVEVEENTDYIDRGATATDDEDVDLIVEVDNPVDIAEPKTYTVRYTVTDSQGQPADPRTRTD
jgi:hypothetical protein